MVKHMECSEVFGIVQESVINPCPSNSDIGREATILGWG